MTSNNKNRKSERTKELKARGFMVYEASGLSGELNSSEKIFLEELETRIRKRIKNFKSHGCQLKSFNIIFD